MRSWVQTHPRLSFVLLAFGISWALGIPALDAGNGRPERMRSILDLGSKFGLSIAGVSVAWVSGGSREVQAVVHRLVRWRIGVWWLVLVAPLALWTVAGALYLALSVFYSWSWRPRHSCGTTVPRPPGSLEAWTDQMAQPATARRLSEVAS